MKVKTDYEPEQNAYIYLACHDVIERLDTLILEIRHIQKNIVYVLRTPELYYPITKEEKFIWPIEDTKNEFLELDCDYDKLINNNIIYYPEQLQIKTSEYDLSKDNKTFINKLQTIVNNRFSYGIWNYDQRAHYHNLAALQRIKANVVKDKIRLSDETAHYFFRIAKNNDEQPPKRLAHLLLLRAVILARARQVVGRVGDQQAVFSLTQDYGLQDHPRPNINRRSDQHLYSVHLADRCRDIYLEMELLADNLTLHADKKSKPKFGRPDFFHRYCHAATSSWKSFQDEISQSATRTDQFYNINTSYWMPDRPELQSSIAHEVAHTLIKTRLDNLRPQTLDQIPGKMADFLKHIHQAVTYFHRFDDSPEKAKAFCLEITADILAASITGPAYFYALFLEIFGVGLEHLFENPLNPDNFDIDIMKLIDEGGFNDEDFDCEWYCRLKITALWIDRTHPKLEVSACRSHVECMTKSVILLADQMIDYLENKSMPLRHTALFWKSFTERLEIIVVEAGELTGTVQKWLEARANDHYTVDKDKKTVSRGDHIFQRHSRRLHWEVRNFLSERLYQEFEPLLKPREGSADCQKYPDWSNCNLEELFQNSGMVSNTLRAPSIFPRLVDIPWQYALFRAKVYVHQNAPLQIKDTKSWRQAVRDNSQMGRGFYQLALEIYLSEYAPPYSRLSDCCGWVGAALQKLDHLLPNVNEYLLDDCKCKLSKWIGESDAKGPEVDKDEQKQILKFFEEVMEQDNNHPKPKKLGDHKMSIYSKNWLEIASKSNAIDLLKYSYALYSGDVNKKFEELGIKDEQRRLFKRRLFRLQGFKLEELQCLLEELIKNLTKVRNTYVGIDNKFEDMLGSMVELVQYLKVHQDNHKDDKTTNVISNQNIQNIIKALTPSIMTPSLFQLRRFYIAGTLKNIPPSQSNDQQNIGSMIGRLEENVCKDSKNIKDYVELTSQQAWRYLSNSDMSESNYMKENYCVTLGRNDIISIAPVDTQSHCWMPDIPFSERDKYPLSIPTYLPFFERDETALKVNCRAFAQCGNSEVIRHNPIWRPLVFLSVSLRRATSRLDFLIRLLKGINENNPTEWTKNRRPPVYIKDLFKFIPSEEMDIYLCDGWADLLIVFYDTVKPEESYQRLIDIFYFQQVLFEDFQVDRTEIVPTPACANLVIKNYDKGEFTLSLHARILEDRYADRKNMKFVKQITTALINILEFEQKDFVLTRTPGRLDFSLYFPHKIPSQATYSTLIGIFLQLNSKDADVVDRVLTTIAWNENTQHAAPASTPTQCQTEIATLSSLFAQN